MADPRELWVWMNGERVGKWQRTRTGGHRFVYEESWLASDRVRPLSLSLPITPDRTVAGPVVANFFDNLLPDDERIRRRVSARFKVGSTDVFELLQAIGRDCVGAVQLLPPEQPPTGFDRVECGTMDDQAVARHLHGVAAEPGLPADQDLDDLRISIAGAQEKTALLRVDGQWCRPLGATPTTHILKLPLGLVGGRRLDLTHSVYNEWLCAQLLRSSRTAPADIRHFLCAQPAFWLLAATDGHAKNFSIFLLPGGGYRMTPLYDVTSVWPVISNGPNLVAWQEAKLAMAVRSKNVHYELAVGMQR